LANPEIFSADSECSDSELDDVLAEFDDPWYVLKCKKHWFSLFIYCLFYVDI